MTYSRVQDRRHDAHIIFTSTNLYLELSSYTRLLPSWRDVVTHTGDEVSYGRRAAPRLSPDTRGCQLLGRKCAAVIWRIPHLRVRPPCFRSLSCNCWRAASPLHNAKVVPSDKSAPSARWLALSTLQFTDLTRYIRSWRMNCWLCNTFTALCYFLCTPCGGCISSIGC